ELVAEHLPRLARVELGDRVRIHDSCHLGRGLGLYDPPRAILGAILGRAPDEFVHRRDEAVCSGGGGLLPVTARETART
ncbi:(Fe-S)-binding protein, partial [Raoultella planticola]|uniref:heterodisulfide reductase-related iron-sulfur binding cluster n=1 Tax=Raoultella planticola TaxID=575 RepID=UPI0024801F32